MMWRELCQDPETFPWSASNFSPLWFRVFTLVPQLVSLLSSPNPSRVLYSSSKSPLILRHFSRVQYNFPSYYAKCGINKWMQRVSQVKYLHMNWSVRRPQYSSKGGTPGIWAACGETALPCPSADRIRYVATSPLSVWSDPASTRSPWGPG